MSTAAPVDRDRPIGPRSRKGAATRARLLEAAKEVFEKDGFLEARITDITERAGLSHGSFYHYFDSKEEIFREVTRTVMDLLRAPLSTVIFDPDSVATPRERIREGIRRFVRSYRKEARIIGLIEQVSRYDEQVKAVLVEHQQRDFQLIVDSIRQLQRRGQADPNLNPVTAITALVAMVNRFAEMWLVQRSIDSGIDDGADQLALLFSNALRLSDKPAEAVTFR